MSSLAATQADGYYLPPEYYESGAYKKQGKNGWYQKQQQQSSSSKKTDKNNSPAAITVRFELVDPCVCEGCDARIGKGTRFNAEKRPAGFYLDQPDCPLWEFTLYCRMCRHEFHIRTDPAIRGFQYGPGIRRQVREWKADSVQGLTREESHGRTVPEDDDEDTLLTNLQKSKIQQREYSAEIDRLHKLQRQNQTVYRDDADRNAELRARNRQKKQTDRRAQAQARAHGWRSDMTMTTRHDTPQEQVAAASATFGLTVAQQQRRQWKTVRAASIFASGTTKKKHHLKQSSKEQSSSTQPPSSNPVVTLPDGALSSDAVPRKRRRKVISTVDLTGGVRSSSPVTKQDRSKNLETFTKSPPNAQQNPESTLNSLLAGYSSVSSDDD